MPPSTKITWPWMFVDPEISKSTTLKMLASFDKAPDGVRRFMVANC